MEEKQNNPIVFEHSSKSGAIFGILGFFLGFAGVHNFYIGRVNQGIGQLILFVFISLLLLINFLVPSVQLFVLFSLLEMALSLWIASDLLLIKEDADGLLIEEIIIARILGIILLMAFFVPFLMYGFIGMLGGHT